MMKIQLFLKKISRVSKEIGYKRKIIKNLLMRIFFKKEMIKRILKQSIKNSNRNIIHYWD
jgi:hypothetical protein